VWSAIFLGKLVFSHGAPPQFSGKRKFSQAIHSYATLCQVENFREHFEAPLREVSSIFILVLQRPRRTEVQM
jgi:hypothetical protein